MSEKIPNEKRPADSPKQKWLTPEIVGLPPLVDLTLQTGIPGAGSPGDGSTVF